VRFLRLLAVFTRLGALSDLAYRANFWFQLLESAVALATALATIAVVFSQTESLAGWAAAELVALIGVYYLMLGLLNLVIAPSLTKFMEHVQMGTLDFTLTKPADAQLLVSISEVRVWKTIEVALGAAVLGAALWQLAGDLGLGEALAFGVALLCGIAIVYSLWLALATLAFWFIRVENILMIFWNLYWAARWPVGIYPSWLRWTLTLLVPVAFAVTVPAEAVAGRLGPATLLGSVALAAATLVASRLFWKAGLRRYAGASA
jgi:ABC-2 type transport system permease protein